MTSINTLVSLGYDLYSEMEASRWFGFVRSEKSSFLKAVKDSSEHPMIALIELENEALATSKFKTITGMLMTAAKLDKDVLKTTEAHATINAMKEKFLTDFSGLTQQMPFLLAIDKFIVDRAFADNAKLKLENGLLKSTKTADAKKKADELSAQSEKYTKMMSELSVAKKTAKVVLEAAPASIKEELAQHAAPGKGCALYNLRPR